MDDTKKSAQNQQPIPIYENVPTVSDSTPPVNTEIDPSLQPEEVAPNVEIPEESAPTGPEMIPDQPPVYVENKSKYMIIIGAVIFFVVIFFVLFSFLSKKGSGPASAVKLIYWGLWDDPALMQPLIATYQAQHPTVTIDYQKMSPDQYREKLLARSKNGQGPDMFRFHNTWLPELKDVVSPLPATVMSSTDFEKTFYPIHKNDLKIGNYYFGMPLSLDGLILIYNDSMLKKVGISEPPATWDDLITDAGKLSTVQSGQIITSGISLGTANNVEHFSDILALMLVENGVDLTKLDQPEAASALEAYRRFAEKPNNVWDENQENNIQAFIHEKVAMIFAPSWEILTIRGARADLEVKAAPIPRLQVSKPVSIASYWVEGVSKYSKQQVEAWKFLAFLAQKDSLTQLYELQAKSRGFGTPVSRVDMGNIMMENQYTAVIIKQADAYVSLPMINRTFDNGMNDQIVKYMENAVNATIQGTSYAEAMKVAKQGVDQVLAQYK